ncbi:MAG: AAA family ATPase [Lewinellaceae bacterium]|nr:AAA family ATPase [Lewinellaceae bacterium]
MIKELTIKNFRSIREATLELGKFTVLNGANNSGKSSVLYALQVLKNVVTNPNQSLDSLLNLHFLNLGGIEEVEFGRKKNFDELISLNVCVEQVEENGATSTKFGWFHDWHIGTGFNIAGVFPLKFIGSIGVSFPYSLNKTNKIKLQKSRVDAFDWNGLSMVKSYPEADANADEVIWELTNEVELPILELSQLDVTPTHRGFTKPIFNQVPMSGTIYTEEEVATHLAIDKTLQAKVSHYFEKIAGKRFSVSMGPGGGFFYLQVREPDTPFTTELVNQGMGINQILFLLAKILYDKNRLICIDEPEIHLHPTLIEQFVKVLVEIAEKEDKQFIFSTHSEHWMMSLLAEVYEKNLAAEDLKVCYLEKEGQETIVESQKVHPNGQIEGGLKNFMEAQMRLANRFFPAETPV